MKDFAQRPGKYYGSVAEDTTKPTSVISDCLSAERIASIPPGEKQLVKSLKGYRNLQTIHRLFPTSVFTINKSGWNHFWNHPYNFVFLFAMFGVDGASIFQREYLS